MWPVKVFGSAAFTNVARVLVWLEEVGAEYEIVDVDFHAKEHKGPEHLARNVPISLADLRHFPHTHYLMGMPYVAVFDEFPSIRAWW
nr:unnamed protein product [Digitaria exilis]